MKPRDHPEVAPWLALAQADMHIAALALAQPGSLPEVFGLVCFHGQQAAEKALKGLLSALDVHAPRTHDLMRLAEGLPSDFAPPREVLESLAAIADFGVGPRYPMPGRHTSRDQAAEALEAASQIIAWVLQNLR